MFSLVAYARCTCKTSHTWMQSEQWRSASDGPQSPAARSTLSQVRHHVIGPYSSWNRFQQFVQTSSSGICGYRLSIFPGLLPFAVWSLFLQQTIFCCTSLRSQHQRDDLRRFPRINVSDTLVTVVRRPFDVLLLMASRWRESFLNYERQIFTNYSYVSPLLYGTRLWASFCRALITWFIVARSTICESKHEETRRNRTLSLLRRCMLKLLIGNGCMSSIGAPFAGAIYINQ